jgi:hypothetical protein
MGAIGGKTKLVDRLSSVIEDLLQSLLSDLKSGMKAEEAGWRLPVELGIDSSIQNELLRKKIIEKSSVGKMRFNLKNNRIRQQFGLFDLQFKQLDYFLKTQEIVKSDIEKIERASKMLNQIKELLQIAPEAWTYIIALGWWKMLESSGMPALIDDILREGFSPKEWTIKATLSAPQLALSVGRKFGEIDNFEEALSFLRKNKICSIESIFFTSSVNQVDIQRIKRVLKWEDIERSLNESSIKMLSFLWFSLFILECNDLLPLSDEISPKLIKEIWKPLENLLGRSQSNLLEEMDGIINALIEEGITWTSSIIHVPEAM